jgi:hypothetical protein
MEEINPGAPPTRLFLKMFNHAKARVQDGIIYGKRQREESSLFQRILVRVINHAKPPPEIRAIAQAPKEVMREWRKGL